MRYKINKQKCTGCQLCVSKCPGATTINSDGKAEIINQEKLEQCGGESVCPFGAIEKIGDEEKKEETEFVSGQGRGFGMDKGQGMGQGRGMGAGRGRGLGMSPRDGRGGGRGGGGRR